MSTSTHRAGRRSQRMQPRWSDQAGRTPHVVTVEERLDRGGALYLRWWPVGGSNWEKRSLMRALSNAALGATALRDANGEVIDAVAHWAIDQAWGQYRKLAGLAPADAVAGVPSASPLTIGQAWAVISDRDTGKYPQNTPHRREVERALAFACTVWGADTAWAGIGRLDITKLRRQRLTGLLKQSAYADGRITGLRATEITVARVLAVAKWLREQGVIPATACIANENWRDDLKADWLTFAKSSRLPKPNQPRYTHEEVLALMIAADRVDARLSLALALGAEFRLGQVIRASRSDLDLTPSIEEAPHGTFTIHGMGEKGGEVVYLTAGQRAAVEGALSGYLAPLETEYQSGRRKDYPLLPSGRMTGILHQKDGAPLRLGRGANTTRSVGRDWITRVWPKVEAAARVDGKPITHVRGRGPYGVRRVHVDQVLDENISTRGLQAAGGWSSPDVPMTIYAERANRAGRKEAMEKRATIRGETVA